MAAVRRHGGGAPAAGLRAPSGWRERYPGFGLRITRWGVVFLVLVVVVGLAAVNTGNNSLMMVLGLALGSYAVSGAWSRQVLGGVVVQVERPREAYAGRPAPFAITLHNTSRLPAYGLVVRDHRGRPLLVEPLLAGGRSVRHGVEMVLPRRGWTEIGPWRLEVLLPLGFFLKSKRVEVGGALLVYPRLVRGATAHGGDDAGRAVALKARDRGREGEVTQLRGFRPGDEHRQVHWKQTARQQRMIVTDRQHYRQGPIWLKLQTRLDGPHDAAALERFEAAVSAMAEEVVRRLGEGETVGVALGERRLRAGDLTFEGPRPAASAGRGRAGAGPRRGGGMSRGELRRLLGGLLAWAILPLPLTGITLLAFWVPAAAAAAWLVARPERPLRLGTTAQNLIAIAILAAVLAAAGLRVGPLRPLGHLLLLLAAVRVLLVEDRRGMVRAMPAVALLWLVSVASSTHVTLLAYLLGSAALAWWAGMRIVLDGLPAAAVVGRRAGPRPLHAAVAGLVACALAVPVFLAMPRLRSPFVAGSGGARAVSGFSTAVELGSVGAIRESREVALVLTAPSRVVVEPQWTRLRATAFDLVRTGVWAPRRAGLERVERDDEMVRLDPDASLRGAVKLEIELLEPERYLFLPEGAVAVRAPVPLWRDPAGGLLIGRRLAGALRYEVWVSRRSLVRGGEPADLDLHVPRLSPEVAQLAELIAGGEHRPRRLAEQVERYLARNYSYSLDAAPRRFEPDPVGWFLTEGRAGHCEYFAGSMVVLLRSLGVPSRMVGGYAGGSSTPSGREVLVRQANAHTWVEVWLGPREGWQVFDPTPGEGVPGLEIPSRVDRLRNAKDWLMIAWDRHILTFGLADQVELTASAVGALLGAARSPAVAAGLAALAAAGLGLAGWRVALRPHLVRRIGRRRRPAASAVRRLERRLQRLGEPLPASVTVRRIGAAAARRWPPASSAAMRLVELAEVELYGPDRRAAGSRDEVARAWAALREAIRSD